MKKIILGLLICFLVSGCSVDYEINFDEKIEETINFKFDGNIYETAKEIDGDGFYAEKELVEEKIPSLIRSADFYDKTINANNSYSNVTLKYNYTYENFLFSYLLDNCYEKTIFSNDKDTYYVSLSGNFLCFKDSNITVKAKSKYKVLINNADEVKNGYYIWNLNMNEDNHDIKFQVSKNEINNKISATTIIKIIVAIAVAIGAGAYLLFKKKVDN